MDATTKPLVVVGSLNMDLVVGAATLPQPGETLIGTGLALHHGGKGGNQAVAAARLGHPVRMIGAVGDDAFGPRLVAGLAEAGVDTGAVLTVSGPSGTALITTASDGENTIVVVPGANAALTPAHLEMRADLLGGAGMIMAQLEIPMDCIAWLADFARRAGVPLMLDPAPGRALPAAVLRDVAWLTPNETETAILLGGAPASDEAAAAALLALGARRVALKLGARGCLLADGTEAPVPVAAPRVDVVDTVAAGDAFNGAFAVRLLRGNDAPAAARFAAAVAALSVTRAGAQPSMPTAREVADFLAYPSVTA